MFDMKDMVVERIRRGSMYHKTAHEMLWSLTQIKDPQLTMSADKAESMDALGAPIMSFDRAKTGELTGSNAMINLDLMAAQSGTSKRVAATGNSFNQRFTDYPVAAEADKLSLTFTPVLPTGEAYAVPFVYRINGDGSLGQRFAAGETAGPGVYEISGKELTFDASEVVVGDRFIARYEYTVTGEAGMGGVEVTNTATNFPKAGEFVLEVFVYNPCDSSTKYAAEVVFPNAKLSSGFDITFATDTEHPFTIEANQDYCDPEKKLYYVFIPELAIAA